MAETITLGIVGIKNMGEYDSQTKYEKLNVVTYQGSTYCALQETKGNLPTDTDYWQLYAEKGGKGDTGDTGPQGPKPVKGVDYYTQEDKAEISNEIAIDVTSEVTDQLSNLTSATPIAVSSTSGMTDTSRIYVLTTDGHWYWYNGSVWTDGGVYQGTEVDNNSVTYKNIKALLKNEDFVPITADDLFWRKGYTTYQGIPTTDNNTLIGSVFILPKGNNIQINSDFNARITYYNLDGEYIGNTGSYREISSWSYTDDCIVRINIVRKTNPEDTVVTDGNSTNVVFTGIKSKKYNYFSDNITFRELTSTRAISSVFYATKGTKISLFDCLLKKDNSAINSFVKFGVQEAGASIDMTNNSYWQTNGTYTVQKDGNLQIGVMFGNNGEVADFMDQFNDLLYIEPSKYNEIKNNPVLYVGNNANVDIIETGGNIALYLGNTLIIYNDSTKYEEIAFSDILELFPDNILEISGQNYLKIPAYNIFYYDLIDKKFCINRYNTGTFLNRKDIVILLANGYQNVCDGKLLNLYYKKQIASLNNNLGREIFNSSPISQSYDWKTQTTEFSKQVNNMSKNIESFMFFTDPHLLGHDYSEDRLQKFINTLQKYYNSTPTSFIVCGGDWLGNSDTQDEACLKLGYMDGFMNSMFDNYYPILGNHDTNYQGKIDEESAAWSGELTKDTEINLMFRKFKKMYYSFDGINSKNYVLDTQLDNATNMDTYKWEQVYWLAQKLISDDFDHATVMMHIIWNTSSHNLIPFTDNITQLIHAYNTHDTITLNNVSYDFSNCTGHVDYVLGGHLHADYNDTINGVLCIATASFAVGHGDVTFDGIINDYDNNKVYLYRFGDGENREFSI